MNKTPFIAALALSLLAGSALAGSEGMDNARAMRERMGTQTSFERQADSAQTSATQSPSADSAGQTAGQVGAIHGDK